MKEQLQPETPHTVESSKSLFQDNIDSLREQGELGYMFSVLYGAAVEKKPDLSEVIVLTSGSSEDETLKTTGGFARHAGETKSGRYEIVVNTADGIEHYAELLERRKNSVVASFEKMGFGVETLDPKVLAGFIFLHELGHLVDFMENAPTIEQKKMRRNADMSTLPVSGYNPVQLMNWLPTEGGATWFTGAKQALNALYGISTMDELAALQDDRYRALPTEDGPDRFAAEVIKPYI